LIYAFNLKYVAGGKKFNPQIIFIRLVIIYEFDVLQNKVWK